MMLLTLMKYRRYGVRRGFVFLVAVQELTVSCYDPEHILRYAHVRCNVINRLIKVNHQPARSLSRTFVVMVAGGHVRYYRYTPPCFPENAQMRPDGHWATAYHGTWFYGLRSLSPRVQKTFLFCAYGNRGTPKHYSLIMGPPTRVPLIFGKPHIWSTTKRA